MIGQCVFAGMPAPCRAITHGGGGEGLCRVWIVYRGIGSGWRGKTFHNAIKNHYKGKNVIMVINIILNP